MSGRQRGEGVQVVSVNDDGTYRVCVEALQGVAACAELRGLPVAVVSVAGATRGGKSFLLDFCLRYLRATVVVLLMDTQGTFDNSSTVRDCTTIFAMSTLISSVQIYNLAQQIKEDDLQHLQLFTEYGNRLETILIIDIPRQRLDVSLRTPVRRDWWRKLFGIYSQNRSKKEELQELRGHIRDSFESISCFLMPHPGFAVTDENFSGRLCDSKKSGISEFRGLMLTHSTTPSSFKTKIGTLEPTSLCLLLKPMKKATESSSVPRDAMPRLHSSAKNAARQAFLARRTLAAPERAAERLDRLTKELDDLLQTYIALNDAKTQKLVAASRAAYDEFLDSIRGGRPLCLHPADVSDVHAAAVDAAAAAFDSARQPPQPGQRDDERNALLQYIQEQFDYLEFVNKGNNKSAKQAAVFCYNNRMASVWGPHAYCLHPDSLRSEHTQALQCAFEEFRTVVDDKAQEDEIKETLEQRYEELRSINIASNDELVSESYRVYTQKMDSKCTPSLTSILVVPWLVKVLVMIPKYHQQYRKEAIDHFRSKRRGSGDDDEYIDRLKSKLDEGYESYCHPLHALAREFGIPT